MIIDLTLHVAPDSPLVAWAKKQRNPYVAMGHIGTHLDTYERRPIPLEYFKSRGVLFDVRGIGEVQLSDIDLDLVRRGDFVLFRTGRMEEHAYGSDGYFAAHPQLSETLIHALLDKGIRFIGIDAPGIRRHEEHEAADRCCEQRGVYVIENLHGLSAVPPSDFTVYTLWFDNDTLTGLPCRVVVESE